MPNSSPRPVAQILIILFFLASLAATGIAWWTTAKAEENRLRENFFLDSNAAHRWLADRLLNYSYLFGSIRAFVENSETVTRVEWQDYSQRAQITNLYPGLRSIVYAPRVKRRELTKFVNQVKKANSDEPAYADYSLKLIDPDFPENQTKTDFFPVLYTEGANRTERLTALGYDVSSEKERASAVFTARDSDAFAATPPIRFVIQPINNGFGIILPIYQKGLPKDTLADLRQAFSGIIYAPFDINQFFDAILKPNWLDAFPNLDFEVYDFASKNPDQPLYDKVLSTNITRQPTGYYFSQTGRYQIYNRRWEIYTGLPKEAVANPYRSATSLTILISGLIASLATFFYLQKQLQS